MATATKLAGNEEEKGMGSKGKCNGNEGGGHQRGLGQKGDGNGNLMTRAAGKRTVMAMMKAMVMKTKEAGEEEGDGKGGKRDGNGKEDGNSKQQ
jgi:hypothetical protein